MPHPRVVLLITLLLALSISSGHGKKTKQPPQQQPQLDPKLRKEIEEKMKDMPSIPEGQDPGKVPVSIHDAVLDEDLGLIQVIMHHGGDMNEIGQGGQTPLIHAALHGKESSVAWLLKHGADASIPEDNGWTVMHAAAFAGKPGVVKVLLENNISAKDRLKDGLAPIHRACWGKEQGHTEVVELLLQAGVPHDMPTSQGHRPLDILQDNNPATATLLRSWAKKGGAKFKKVKAKEEL